VVALVARRSVLFWRRAFHIRSSQSGGFILFGEVALNMFAASNANDDTAHVSMVHRIQNYIAL
jgi:hypothetical protein